MQSLNGELLQLILGHWKHCYLDLGIAHNKAGTFPYVPALETLCLASPEDGANLIESGYGCHCGVCCHDRENHRAENNESDDITGLANEFGLLGSAW